MRDNARVPVIETGAGIVHTYVDASADLAKAKAIITNAKVKTCFPGDAFTLKVSGTIVWNRKVSFEGEKAMALGIRFKDMTPKMSGMLVVLADMIYNDSQSKLAEEFEKGEPLK